MQINHFPFLVPFSFPFHILESHYSSASFGCFAARRFFSEQGRALGFPAMQWDCDSLEILWQCLTQNNTWLCRVLPCDSVRWIYKSWMLCRQRHILLHSVCQCHCVYSTCFNSLVVQSVLWYLGTAHPAMKYASWVIISIQEELASSLVLNVFHLILQMKQLQVVFPLSDGLQEPISPVQ